MTSVAHPVVFERGVVDVRCPRCGRLLMRGSTDMSGRAHLKCPRRNAREACGWLGSLDLSTATDTRPSFTTGVPS